jgi:hypothetical protein
MTERTRLRRVIEMVCAEVRNDFGGGRVPAGFRRLCAEIMEYCDKNENVQGGKRSERFGEYSYTNHAPVPWQTAFGKRLEVYRRMFRGD